MATYQDKNNQNGFDKEIHHKKQHDKHLFEILFNHEKFKDQSFPTIYTNHENKNQLINGFELHQILSNQIDFEDWFSVQATEYGFVLETDFWLIEEIGCFVCLPMAMTLCAIDKSKAGTIIRYYLLSVQYRLLNGEVFPSVYQN